MTEFTKNKIAFAIALLAVLFTTFPLMREGLLGYNLLGIPIDMRSLSYATSILLALSVYFFGLQFLKEHPSLLIQRIGDTLYAIAIVLPPAYFIFFLFSYLLSMVPKGANRWPGDIIIEIISLFVITYQTFRLRRELQRKEKKSRALQYELDEDFYFSRAKRLFDDGYTDLVVIDCYKAIKIAIEKILFITEFKNKSLDIFDSLDAMAQSNLFTKDQLDLFECINTQWYLVVQGAQISKNDVEEALNSTNRLLALWRIERRRFTKI